MSGSRFGCILLLVICAGIVLLPGSGVAGELYRWTDDQGNIHLSNTPPAQGRELKVYEPREVPPAPAQTEKPKVSEPREIPPARGQTGAPKGSPGKAQLEPLKRGGGIIVEALLNRKVTAPLLLDTGASHTILTRHTARELGLPPVERLPRKAFHTAGGVVLSPVTTLQSVRVGSHEVRDVEVAIDVAEHLSIGLLGMNFLRHFKVTVDQEQGRVKFER